MTALRVGSHVLHFETTPTGFTARCSCNLWHMRKQVDRQQARDAHREHVEKITERTAR